MRAVCSGTGRRGCCGWSDMAKPPEITAPTPLSTLRLTHSPTVSGPKWDSLKLCFLVYDHVLPRTGTLLIAALRQGSLCRAPTSGPGGGETGSESAAAQLQARLGSERVATIKQDLEHSQERNQGHERSRCGSAGPVPERRFNAPQFLCSCSLAGARWQPS